MQQIVLMSICSIFSCTPNTWASAILSQEPSQVSFLHDKPQTGLLLQMVIQFAVSSHLALTLDICFLFCLEKSLITYHLSLWAPHLKGFLLSFSWSSNLSSWRPVHSNAASCPLRLRARWACWARNSQSKWREIRDGLCVQLKDGGHVHQVISLNWTASGTQCSCQAADVLTALETTQTCCYTQCDWNIEKKYFMNDVILLGWLNRTWSK